MNYKNKNKLVLSYSQNFLKDINLVKSLIVNSSISKSDIVYEIGPGKGVITSELIKRSNKVVAIEKDSKLYRFLKGKFKKHKNIKLINDDFLKYNLPKDEKYKVFSNIPFNLTADIVSKLTKPINPPIDSYLVIQREAAYRFIGNPYVKESLQSLFLKPLFNVNIEYTFNKTDFKPIPKVDVVLIGIKLLKKSFIDKTNIKVYRNFVVFGFTQWEKTLRKVLKNIFTDKQYQRLSFDLEFSINSKPSDLNFHQWLGLFKFLLNNIPENKKQIIIGAEKRLKEHQKKLQKVHRTRVK